MEAPLDFFAAFNGGDPQAAAKLVEALYPLRRSEGFARDLLRAIAAWPERVRVPRLCEITLALIKFNKEFPQLWSLLSAPGKETPPELAAACLAAFLRACRLNDGLPQGTLMKDLTQRVRSGPLDLRARLVLPEWLRLAAIVLDHPPSAFADEAHKVMADFYGGPNAIAMAAYLRFKPDDDASSDSDSHVGPDGSRKARSSPAAPVISLLISHGVTDPEVLGWMTDVIGLRDIELGGNEERVEKFVARLIALHAKGIQGIGALLLRLVDGPIGSHLCDWLCATDRDSIERLRLCLAIPGFTRAFVARTLLWARGVARLVLLLKNFEGPTLWPDVAQAMHDSGMLFSLRWWWLVVRRQDAANDLVGLVAVLRWMLRARSRLIGRADPMPALGDAGEPLRRLLNILARESLEPHDWSMLCVQFAAGADRAERVVWLLLMLPCEGLPQPPDDIADTMCEAMFDARHPELCALALKAMATLLEATDAPVNPAVWRRVLRCPQALQQLLPSQALMGRLLSVVFAPGPAPTLVLPDASCACMLACAIARMHADDPARPSYQAFVHVAGPHPGVLLSTAIGLAFPQSWQLPGFLAALLHARRGPKTLARWILAALSESPDAEAPLLRSAVEQLLTHGQFDFDAIALVRDERHRLRAELGEHAALILGGLHALPGASVAIEVDGLGRLAIEFIDKAQPQCVLLVSELALSYARRRHVAPVALRLGGAFVPCIARAEDGEIVAVSWWAFGELAPDAAPVFILANFDPLPKRCSRAKGQRVLAAMVERMRQVAGHAGARHLLLPLEEIDAAAGMPPARPCAFDCFTLQDGRVHRPAGDLHLYTVVDIGH